MTTPEFASRPFSPNASVRLRPELYESASVSSVGGATPLDRAYVGLSPEGMLALFESEMTRLDSEVTGIFQIQNSRNQQTAALNEARNVLSRYSFVGKSSDDADGEGDEGALSVCNGALDAALAKLPPGSEAHAALEKAKAILNAGGDAIVWETEMKSASETLTSATSSLGSASQLEMVRLQSLVSQKQQVLSLFSNVLQTHHQMMMSAINNIRGG